MDGSSQLVVFEGDSIISSGAISEVAAVLKGRLDRGELGGVLCFEVGSGAQVELDLRGTLSEVLERVAPREVRGRGRPRLGVVGREVSLFPRHWEWLERQPNGASAALRRLVEQAAKAPAGKQQARQRREALSRVLTAIAGNRPGYEEVCRALFAGDDARLEGLVALWPPDVRGYVVQEAREASRLERGASPSSSAEVIDELFSRVWSFGDLQPIERLVAARYTVHSDPGDPWEGQVLDPQAYARRVQEWRRALPDLRLTIEEVLGGGSKVAVRWRAEGSHEGPWRGVAATHRRLRFGGHAIYELESGVVSGHWQVVDRQGLAEQLGAGAGSSS